MPKFVYVVKNKEGKTFKNVIEVENKKELISRLQKQNYFIVSIKELSDKELLRKRKKRVTKRKFSHKGVTLDDLLTFSRQLATMLKAGVTLVRALDVVLSQAQSKRFYEILIKVKEDVEQGKPLSRALSRYPDVFNQFWCSLIEVGEASGTCPNVLEKLAFYLEQQAAFKSAIISGILYPAILCFVAVTVIVIFAFFIAPKFQEIYDSMNASLPVFTSVILNAFDFLKKNFIYILGFLWVFGMVLKRYIQTYDGRLQFENFMYSLPKIGEIYKLIIVERFCSQMAILVEAGVPILQALDITERLVSNQTCALIVNDIKEGVKAGELIVAPMERSGFFPPMVIQMIMVGEETGELSQMLKHVADFYQNNVKTFMERFSTVIEPVMIIFMGLVIGMLVMAMFLPLFNITQMA